MIESNDLIRVMNAGGISIFLNGEKEIVYLCNNCIVIDENAGYVSNKEDCEHGAEYRK